MKILIADDEKIIRMALRKHLAKWGYEVVEASDGREAWETMCAEDPPRIAILDWMMPEMEGIEVCQRLRECKVIPFIYIILLTVRRDREDIIRAFESGTYDFISKPVHTDELRSRIAVGVRLIEAKDEILAKNKALMEKNDQLELALKEIKTLKGFLPICANCKKIRWENADPNTQESWVSMEEYITKRTRAKFTHSICPECIRKLYPNLVK